MMGPHRNKSKKHLTRLDVIIIKAHRLETKKEILARAKELAKKMGSAHGWTQLQVEESTIPAIREGQRICYFFDVWGVV
ncbi:hypothetical protein [Bdellovibrio sp.]|uniref:hypothetical protein n=1 Tax=Bdellovibrio sp. TaxID=28201 RepID=UPI0039E2D973